MTKFSIGEQVTHPQLPNKILRILWIRGSLAGCARISNGMIQESHVLETQSISHYQASDDEKIAINLTYNIDSK